MHRFLFSTFRFMFLSMSVSFQAVAVPIDFQGFPPCNMQACNSVAAVEKWPELKPTGVQQVTFYGYDLLIPAKGVETRSNYSFRQFDFDSKRWLSLSVFVLADMDELFKASRYTMVDWASIVFTQTPESKVPDTPDEAYAWYSSLISKTVFVGGNMVTQYHKAPLTVYVINETHSENDVLMVVSTDSPEVLLKVEVFGFEKPEIMQLISGLSQSH